MVCQMPHGNPGETAWEQVGEGLERDWSSWLRNGELLDPGTPGQVRSDGTRSALPPKCSRREGQCSRARHAQDTPWDPPGQQELRAVSPRELDPQAWGDHPYQCLPLGVTLWGHLAWQDAQIPPSRWKQTFQIEESAQPILKMWIEHLRETDVQGHTTIPGCTGVQARRFSFCLEGLKKSGPLSPGTSPTSAS